MQCRHALYSDLLCNNRSKIELYNEISKKNIINIYEEQ